VGVAHKNGNGGPWPAVSADEGIENGIQDASAWGLLKRKSTAKELAKRTQKRRKAEPKSPVSLGGKKERGSGKRHSVVSLERKQETDGLVISGEAEQGTREF